MDNLKHHPLLLSNHDNLIGHKVQFAYGTGDIETISKVIPVPSKKKGCYSEVHFETSEGSRFNFFHLVGKYVRLLKKVPALEGAEELYEPFQEAAA